MLATTSLFSGTIRNASSPIPAAGNIFTAGSSGRVNLATVFFFFFFFFNRHCNPCGLWPAQLSLSILSRKVFTECRCQRHVKPPTWRTSDLERSNSRHRESPASETTQANSSSGRWNCGREIPENFAESGDFHVTFGFFYMP